MSDIAEEELTRYAKTFLLVTCCHMAARLADKRARSAAVEAATRQPSFVLEGVIRERVMEYRHVLEPAEVFDPVCRCSSFPKTPGIRDRGGYIEELICSHT